jgi:hypothetical protein
MDAAAPKKKKKGGKNIEPMKVKVVEAEPVFDESTPWKGRTSDFFSMAYGSTAPDVEDPMNP